MSEISREDNEYFESTMRVRQGCDHEFTVTNWVKTEKSKSATQLMCAKCLMLVNMSVVCENNAKFIELMNKKMAAEPQV